MRRHGRTDVWRKEGLERKWKGSCFEKELKTTLPLPESRKDALEDVELASLI